MKKMTNIDWKGEDGKRIPWSTIVSGTPIETEKTYSKKSATRFAYKPTQAITMFNYENIAFKLYTIEQNNELKGLALLAKSKEDVNVFCSILKEGVLYSTSPDSYLNNYLFLFREMNKEIKAGGKSPLMELFMSLDYSALDDEKSKIAIQKDQEDLVGEISSVLNLAWEETKEISLIENRRDFLQAMPKLALQNKVTEWCQPFRYKKFPIEEELEIEKFVKATKRLELLTATEFVKPEQRAKKKRKFSLSSFLKKDWQMMSELEAANLPPVLQMERDRVRKKFEENKDLLDRRSCRMIEQIYNGDLKAASFSGPAGSGKTTAAELIAGALHLPFQLVVGKAGVDTSVYLGYESIVAKNGVSITKWHDGPITQAVRYGAVLLFDEVNLAAPEVVGTLNTLLDDSHALVLDSGEVVKANPKFMYIESMNRGVGYSGTEDTNLSHDNRLLQIRFGAMTKKREIAILEKTTGYHDQDILSILVDIEKEAKKSIQDPSSQLVSIRDLQRWIKEAKYTGEWIESGIDTIITSLVLKDDSLDEITERTIFANGGIGADILDLIMDRLEGRYYD